MKKLYYLGLLLLVTFQLKAQVSDISLNLSPTVNYTWWDSQLFIKDGPMVGGMIGVGFGRNLELRGIYEQSVDLKSTLNNLNMPNGFADQFNSRGVDVTRLGGEFKVNIPTGSFLDPYITLGTGVQKLKYDEVKQEQIYLSGGLGTKFNLSDRVTINLGGKLHAFNIDPSSVLRVDDPEGSDFNNWIDENITNNRMMNWSLNLGVQFYIGGSNPNKQTALDRAIEKHNNKGLSGLRFVFEPGAAYINFDNSTNMRDTYLLGGALGVDFNDYFGLRAFYYQSTEDEKISLDFDNMAMYGTDFTAKLNVARGIVPFITVGGGYMNVYGSYIGVDENPFVITNSSYFAKGGVGLTIPVTRYFEVFGAANLLYTTSKDPEEIETTEDLKKHTMFNAGLKFNVGKAMKDNRGLDSYIDRRVSDKTMMYEQRIAELKKELDIAYQLNDTKRATQIMNEKQRLETEYASSIGASGVESSTSLMPAPYTVATADTATASSAMATRSTEDQTMIRLTPQELESLVDKVVQGVGAPVLKKETPEERLDRLERLVLSGGAAPRVAQQPATSTQETEVRTMSEPEVITSRAQEESISKRVDESNRELLEEMRRISNKIEENSRRIDNAYRQPQQTGSDKTFIVSPSGNQTPYIAPQIRGGSVAAPGAMPQGTSQGQGTSWVINKGLSPFLGLSFGESSSFIFGIKGNYGFSNSRFVFVPDLYFGIGNKVAYGLNANVTYPLLVNNVSIFTPYVGVGLGINKADKFKFGINIIGGTYINVGNGSLFVEYTSRKFFDNNLFSLGYRFNF